MPYEPYDTGWINSIYGSACLFWLLLTNGLLPQFTFMTCYNNIFIPFTKMINQLCEFIGNGIVSVGSGIIICESYIFDHVDYVTPIYNCIKYIECNIATILPQFENDVPSYNYAPSNIRRRKTSTGRHLCRYFAHKRLSRAQQVISGSTKKNDNNNDRCTSNSTRQNRKITCKQDFPPQPSYDYDNYVFHSIDDPSYHDNSWYDAISPYWTGGMVWNGAYVLNHQVVSVTTDPIFVSNLLPEHELSATVHTPQVRSGDENVGHRATIALDSGSSIHIFKDAFLLTDIKADDAHSITVRTTDSKFKISNIGRLCADLNTLPLPSEGYYFYPRGVANILSLAMIAATKRVVMDSAIDNAIYIFNEDGSYVRFAKTPNGMYCIDITTDDDNHIVMAHQTVKEESAHFSAIDCRRAAKVRDLQEALACPSDFDLANAIEHNVIGNNPFTRRDVRIAKKIFGPDVPALKGKTVKRKSKMPREDDISDIPSRIIKEYSDVHLSIDIMHVNGIMFLISYSQHIGLLQTYCVRRNNRNTILNCILKMTQTYKSRSVFNVVSIEADGAFQSIKHELQSEPYNITLTTCDADRHVETVERQIRFLKERIRSVRMMMPYKKIPKRFTIEMVHRVTMLINSLPKQNGIHSILSPREIVTGKKFRCPSIKIGQYVQGLTGGSNNTEQERSIDSLYIGRADNGSGHVVFKLNTKQPVSVNRVTIIPTTDAIIKTVNDMAEQEQQPEGIEFSDMNGGITLQDFAEGVGDDDDSNASDEDFKIDQEYQDEIDNEIKLDNQEVNTDDADPDSPGFGSDEPDSQIDYFQNPIQKHNRDVQDNNEPTSNIIPRNNRGVDPIVAVNYATIPTVKQECGKRKKKNGEDEDVSLDDDLDDINVSSTQDTKVGVDNTHINNDTIDGNDNNDATIPRELDSDLGPYWALAHKAQAYVLNTITSYSNIEASKSTPQYGFNRGLKEFGTLGYEATVKELDDNLLGMGAVEMLKPSEINKNIRYEALNYLMFLKRKRCGKIKARGCADGRPQREYISKDESSSPTVSIYALMTSCLMDAIEGRKVATCDIPGAFLQADWPSDRDCYLKFEGAMVSMICDIDPKYKQNIVYGKNGRKFIYAKLTKAVYGTLLGAILFYEKLTKQLMDWGYEPNCYDRCTFNKMINGNQVTIQFHVDDLKISHTEQSVIDEILSDLNNEFGTKRKPLAATTGLIHDYLGITIDYSDKDKVKFTMYDYLEDILDEMPKDMNGTAPSPASDNMFEVDDGSPLLNEKESDFFHRTTARLLFAAKRARPDLQVAVAYLCTRVKSPNQSDYRKLTRVIKYLRFTIFIPLVLGWDGTGHLTWSVDASFAVHKDMRSHTGAVLSLGQGALMSMSLKQKINTKSSTEAELVAVDDAMNFVEWIQLFVGAQTKSLTNKSIIKKFGCDTIVLQDNTSTIQLENNGQASSTKRTRHINIRYFYVTSKIKEGSMRVIYCPTKQMVSDYLTKPLQGSLFRTHRNAIMGHSEDSISMYRKEYSDAKTSTRVQS
jgi:hypothetical protein